jgi:branched-chain amino acid transport system permease protein
MKAKSNVDALLPIKIGLIGGIVAVSIALEGMIQAFSARDIVSGVISMGHMLLLITLFASSYIAISRSGASQPARALFAGALSGVVSSSLVVVLLWTGNFLPLGGMFLNATSQLYALLTFKQGVMIGSLFMLILGLGMGATSALVYLLPGKVRQSVLGAFAVVVAFGVLQELVTVTSSTFDALTPVIKFLYATNGLSTAGAITIFVAIAGISYLWSQRGTQIQSGINRLSPTSQRALRWTSILVGIAILLLLPKILGLYLSEVLDNVGLYLLMGLGLNIVVGFAGLLDLGYVAFFAIGAYTTGVLTSPELGRALITDSWWLAFPFAIAVAVLAGVVLGIPVLKMRGDYLAIVTLGFGEIIRILVGSDFLRSFLGGSQGVLLIAKPEIGPIKIINPPEFYYLFLGGCLLVIFISVRVKNSRLGRAWMAMREDEDVAQAMGIDLVATKLLAFGMGAAFGGLAGAMFASKLGSVYPASFNFLVSVNVLCLIIIGGMGSIPGVVIGALALVGLPELLREFAEFRYLFYGAALVVMMLTRPEGLVPEARRRIELEEFREEGGESPPGADAAVLKTMGQP